jgi:trigger factor
MVVSYLLHYVTMQVTTKQLSDTKVQLTLEADAAQLKKAKEQTLRALAKDMKLPGFRPGKAPLQLIEKNANQSVLQNDFLEYALNVMYGQALDQENIRPVVQPQVTVKKFVPFTTLEIEAEVEVIGKVTLADYKNLKHAKEAVKITAKDVDEVITQLQTREAEKKDVDRAAKDGDQIFIDFTGVDAKTGEPIGGADGKDYPLALGSNTFIPGFEPNLIGLKAGDEKIFTITFPADYGVPTLQNRNVEFNVTVKKVQEMTKPKADDAFAAKVGPFKALTELKEDIKKQLTAEKENQSTRTYEEAILNEISDKSKVAIPASLIEQEITRMEADERQNLVYRGQTWQEHLEAEGVTEEQHREQKRGQAERRVKAGLVLAEIAEKEGIMVTPEEADIRIQLLKGQYQDKAMQAELDKAENRREIASRLLTEKTIEKLVSYASAKATTK